MKYALTAAALAIGVLAGCDTQPNSTSSTTVVKEPTVVQKEKETVVQRDSTAPSTSSTTIVQPSSPAPSSSTSVNVDTSKPESSTTETSRTSRESRVDTPMGTATKTETEVSKTTK